jgi:transketolase
MLLNIAELSVKSQEYRKQIIKMIYDGGAGHPGGALSCIDFLNVIYQDEVDFSKEYRSRVVLSKGHAVPAQYAILHDLGFIAESELKGFRNIDSRLEGHPHALSIPQTDATTGLLGQGLSIGVGMAMGKKINKDDSQVFVILGDGEMQEGQIWEAIMEAGHYGLSNLVVFVDKNGLSSHCKACEQMNIDPLDEKFKAFNWNATEIDGHDFHAIRSAINSAKNEEHKPTVIIANTVKGKGVTFMENNPQWHSGVISDAEYEIAMQDLATMGVE